MEEILMDILSRLPVKSLFRFECVSKYWKKLISEPYFKKKHLNYAKNQPISQKLLFHQWSPYDINCHFYCSSLSLVQLVKDNRRFDCPSNCNPVIGIQVYCSCDGLILIGIWSEENIEQPLILLIWNPSTGESTLLPHSKSSLQMGHDPTSDDDDEGSTYGLSYDSIDDDYKVFRIDMSGNDYNEIFSLKNNCWRIIDETLGETDNFMLSGGVHLAFVHGAFHWLGVVSKYCVISFNISDETYEDIPLPEIVVHYFRQINVKVDVDLGLLVLGGKLGVYYDNEKELNLWIMKEYGIKNSWIKLFAIPSAEFFSVRPKYMFSDNEVLLSFQDRVAPEVKYRIISCVLLGFSNRIWPLDSDDIDAITIDEEGTVYTESLISPKLGQ